ncbi:MAG: hypothetical protein ACEY3D_08690 [Rickettsia sp.]|uniref:hypothetical protein n=1 Tax=Rickettsia sp. TaxID=789 RepID=UPI00397A7377
MSFLRKQESRKNKHKYSKFLKLKARFISLYAGFPLSREGIVAWTGFPVIARKN